MNAALKKITPIAVTNIEAAIPSHVTGNGGRPALKPIAVTLMPDKTPITAMAGPAYRQNRKKTRSIGAPRANF